MAKIQPAPCIANGGASDRHLVVSEGSGCVGVCFGAGLLERVHCSEEVLQCRSLGKVRLGWFFWAPRMRCFCGGGLSVF